MILTVAFEIIYEKFQAIDTSHQLSLLRIGDPLVVEDAPRDCVWDIGHKVGHPSCKDPRTWKNGNILDYTLMKARNILKEEVN